MDQIIVLESLTAEQHKSFFEKMPIFTPAIKHDREAYLNMMSDNNELLKQLLSKMEEKGFALINGNSLGESSKIEFLINSQDLKILKQIKNQMNESAVKFKMSSVEIDKFDVIMEIATYKDILSIKQIIESYLSVNKLKNNISEETIYNFIIKKRGQLKTEYVDYIKTVNKNSIMHIKEMHRQKKFQMNKENISYEIKDMMKNTITVREIYELDPEYKLIPYNQLNDKMKYTMCNKYFQYVVQKRLTAFVENLKQRFNINFQVNYNKQQQNKLPNYGITGNLPPFDLDKVPEVMVYTNSNLNFCFVDKDIVRLNEDLLGQFMITILHEHQHIMQRLKMIDKELSSSIENFETFCTNDENYYIDNYNNDPSELDSNLTSFIRFKEMSKNYGVERPDDVIIKNANRNSMFAESSYNFYGGIEQKSYTEIIKNLKSRLIDSTSIHHNYSHSVRTK